MITIIVGGIGQGKSLLGTFLAKKYAEQGYPVFVNWHTQIKGVKLITKEDLRTFQTHGGKLFLDEASTMLDSRRAMSRQNIALSHILKQSRKRGADVFLLDQMLGAVDSRARNLASLYVLAERKEYPRKGTVFEYTFVNKGTGRSVTLRLPYRKAMAYFSLYDTDELVDISEFFEEPKRKAQSPAIERNPSMPK